MPTVWPQFPGHRIKCEEIESNLAEPFILPFKYCCLYMSNMFFAEPVNADLCGGQVYLLKEACVAIGSVPATDLFTPSEIRLDSEARLTVPTAC